MIVWQSNTKEILPFDVYLFKSRVLRALFHFCIFYFSFFYTSSTASYRDWCSATTLESSRMEIINRNLIWALLFHSSFFSPFHPKSMMTIKHNDTCVMHATYTAPQVHIRWNEFHLFFCRSLEHIICFRINTRLYSSLQMMHNIHFEFRLNWKEFGHLFSTQMIRNHFFLYSFWSSQMMSAWDCMNEEMSTVQRTLTHVDVRWLIQSHSRVINVQNIFR